MEQIIKIIKEYFNIDLLYAVLSNKRNKSGSRLDKIKIRPVLLKQNLYFQVTYYENDQVFHKNLKQFEVETEILPVLENDFKQMQVEHKKAMITILISKKGQVTVKKKRKDKDFFNWEQDLSHNRSKQYILEEGKPIPFFIDLGVMNEEGKVLKVKYDKFRQINRFLEFIEDILPKLPQNKEIKIIDFGCGKSYLTFAMYYYLKELKGYDIQMIGLDLKTDVIRRCNEIKDRYGYEKLTFYKGDIASYEGTQNVDMVVTLHACDTATDYALAKAVQWDASVILSVPCCQHELNGQIENAALSPVLKYGLLKERLAALVTDGLRGELLEQAGYQVQMLDFIDMEHTPKNILIRAVKNKNTKKNLDDYQTCASFLNVSPTLAKLLTEQNKGDKS